MAKNSKPKEKAKVKSSDTVATKIKVVTKVVGGLAFKPRDPRGTYPSVVEWFKAGMPENVYVYDHLDTLKVCGFPLCDTAFVRGMYRRTRPAKPKKAEIQLIAGFLRDLKPAEVKSKSEGIQVAETKDHHKMVY